MKHIKNLFRVGLMSIALCSCTDLTEEPFDILTSDNYFTDKASVEATILRPYEHGQWCGWDGDRWHLQELTGDHFVWTQKGRHGQDDGVWVRLHGHSWNYLQGQINGGWVGPYQGIGQINMLLNDFKSLNFEAMGMTETDKSGYVSELRALRAWYYVFLIDFFRHVPLVDENTTTKDMVGQSSPQDIFAFIESELKEVIPQLKKESISGRFSAAPAAAVLARLYFNAKIYIDVDKSAECKTLCEDLIANKYGAYSINQNDYRDPFRSGVAGYKSPENVFEFPHARNIYQFGGMWGSFMHYTAGQALGNPDGGNNGVHLQPSRDLNGNIYQHASGLGNPYEKYADCDYRKQTFHTTDANGGYEGFFMAGDQFKFDSKKGYGTNDTPVNGTEEYKGKQLSYVDQVGRFSESKESMLAKGSNVSTGEENSGIRINKFPYLPDNDKGLFHSQVAPEIRLSEMYYMIAEIEYKAGNKQKAAELLDYIRIRNYPSEEWSKYSYTANPTKLTDQEFIDEWGREFLGERRRRTDLIRWGRFGDAWWDKEVDSNDKDYTVFPIPQKQLDSNPKLIQTTRGW